MTTPQASTSADSEGARPTRIERVRVGLRRLERATLTLERPVNRAIGSARFNPLSHTGTLSVFFFVVVFVSGLILTAWFRLGFEDSYLAVEQMESNIIGRTMRAVHRYGSVALVIVSILHGWRTFVQDRFRGPRWLAWVTGIWMVGFLWIIGVTGYWLLWDERAQALNEVLIRAFEGTTAGLDFLLDFLLTPAAGSGWQFILLLLVIHIALSLVIGVLLVYHLRRLTPRTWFPPLTWTVAAGVSLLVLSLLWPVGVLPAFDAARVPTSFPVDPFYLFLFPLGLNFSPWVVWGLVFLSGVLLTVIPWIRRRRVPPPIIIDEDRCTGCTLCVADCPYGALEMVPRDDGKHRQLAVLVPNRCVSCGVCIGSCTDDAMSLPDEHVDEVTRRVLAAVADDPGSRLVIACERHESMGRVTSGDASVVAVNCAGAIHPHLAQRALDAGAAEVQIVGCPAADCANRNGNQWAQDRIERLRVPRLRKPYLDAPIATDWVSPVDFGRALEHPGGEPVADPGRPAPTGNWIRLGLVTLVVAAATVALTNLPFDPGFPSAAVVSIALDHQGGAVLLGYEGEPVVEEGAPSRMVVTIDGQVVLDETYPTVMRDGAEVSQALERIEMPAGIQTLRIELYDRVDPGYSTVLFDDAVAVPVGDILNFAFIDQQIESSAEAGESLYYETAFGSNTGCRVCHSLKEGEVIVGPSFHGVGTAAETRVPGLTAEEYLYQSIVDPDAYVVDGFEPGVMLPFYAEILSEDEIENLVAFLLTLTSE